MPSATRRGQTMYSSLPTLSPAASRSPSPTPVPASGPEQAETLFDCFGRAEDERGGNSGAGLGLAIVRAVADAHGGRVGVRAGRRGGGSVWSLWLPRCAAG
jgi:signal transduction histidine kinase